MLLRLLTDYAYDPETRSRFARNPDEVLDEYGVSREERELFKPLDLETIQTRMVEEVPEVVQRIVELSGEWAPMEAIYGPWSPSPRSIDPTSGKTGQSIPFTVRGSGFNFNATVFFTRPGMSVNASGVTVAQDGTSLKGTIRPPESGDYNVVVDNGEFNSRRLRGTLVRAFIARR